MRCQEWLTRELELIGPEVVILLGLPAARTFLGRYAGERVTRSSPRLGDLVGVKRQARVDGNDYSTFVVHHPSGAFQHPDASRAGYREVGEQVAALLAA